MPFAPDLDTWTGSATFSQTGSNSELSLTGGYSTVSRSMNRDDVDGPIFDLDFTWQAGANTVVGISGSQQIVPIDPRRLAWARAISGIRST